MADPDPPGAPSDARPRRRGARPPWRGRTALAAIAASALVAVVAVLLVPTHHIGSAARTPGADPRTAGGGAPTDAGHTTHAPPGLPPASSASVSVVEAKARADVAAVIAAAPAGGVSVAVRDLTNGRQYSAGATSGMVTASVAKVQILETMLLQNGGPLTGDPDDSAREMIEHSSNDAADDCFADLGGRDDFIEALPKLGLSPKDTVPGPGYYWGLTTTSAAEQLTLLDNLVDRASPLTAPAQQYMLTMMRHVQADQRWGVPAVADPGTVAANKNGWLAIDGDDDLWAVNSDGIVTVHGHEVLVSVMTQHNPDFATGTRRVSALVPALVGSVSA